MPSFDETFGNLALWNTIQKLCTTTPTELQGQELFHAITHKYRQLLKPKLPQWTAPNQSLRQQLTQNPTIGIDSETTTLTPKVLERILQLSTDLRIPEDQATTLYAQVSSELETIQAIIPSSIVDQASLVHKFTPTTQTARDFYFYERHLKWKTLLFLFQSRLAKDSPYLLQATDVLLQDGIISDLIQNIQESTQRIIQLMQELEAAANARNMHNLYGTNYNHNYNMNANINTNLNDTKTKTHFSHVHLLFYQQERQVACEILFFIAYHAQWTLGELVALLDLIRDLTQYVPSQCPFTNVPSPYESLTPTWPATLQEKSFFTWQSDFVMQIHHTGHPALLQSLSLLVATAMAAMDTRQELWDRDSHATFSRGNQIFLPGAGFSKVTALQARLNTDAVANWTRPDIGGLLATSYTLLLRSAGSVGSLGSPQANHSDASYVQAARDLSTAADLKSFTFTRLTMIPCLQRLMSAGSICQVSEFGLAVVAEQFAQYLESLPAGQLPLSRQRWLVEEEEQLQLRRDNQARAKQFEAWQGGAYGSRPSDVAEEIIPTSVDLMMRPDCLDDLIALAVDISALGKEYARNFYGLSVCRTLTELAGYQSKDPTLLPGYLSWLAALCHDTTSANLVYELLSMLPAPNATTTTTTTTSQSTLYWQQLIGNLRWYAQELSPYDTDVVHKPKTTETTKSTTSYYYNLEGDFIQDNKKATNDNAPTTTSTSSDTNKTKELSDSSRYYLASHLAVLRNVARHSEEARHSILSVTLPLGGISTTSTVGDETLLILFKLAIAPLPPTIRGATLATIASLLQPTPTLSTEQQQFIRDQAKHGWEYLETCPLLPLSLLDQYQVAQGARVGLALPPSSVALANAAAIPSLLPKDPCYGLFYEMEHVESQLGWYPSTEGCLELLFSLVSSTGCPSNLGQTWRFRSGAAPYLEYVMDFVLPRLLGTQACPKLPFRVPGDQSRLATKALTVIEAVLIRYNVTVQALNLSAKSSASTILGIRGIAEQVVVSEHETQESLDDYKNLATSTTYSQLGTDLSGNSFSTNITTLSAAPASNIPRPKSPGFCVLADLLSSSGGGLLEALAMILAQNGGAHSIHSLFGGKGDDVALAYATFGSTVPNLISALEGAKEGEPSKPKQTFLKPLLPAIEEMILDSTTFDNGVSWREQSIVVALRIICAAAAREEAFCHAIAASPETLKIVPTLRFQPIRFGSSNLKVIDVAPSRLSTLLYSTTHSQYIRMAIVEYIGYKASDDQVDAQLSALALALTFFLQHNMRGGIRVMMGSGKPNVLSGAVASRFLVASRRFQSLLDGQSISLILNWILADLREGAVVDGGLVQVLLGLPSESYGGNWIPNHPNYAKSNADCFDAFLEFLQGAEYAFSTEQSAVASSCLEILFRLYDLIGTKNIKAVRVVVYTAQRLRAIDFWNTQLFLWLSSRGLEPLRRAVSCDIKESNPQAVHCMAWLLKGIACEMNLLVGFASDSIGTIDSAFASFISPRPLLCQRLLDLLFGSDESVLAKLIEYLPLDAVDMNPLLLHPPDDALRAGVESWPGSNEVASGYYRVDKFKVLERIKSKFNEDDLNSMEEWIDFWNSIVARNCAASHFSSALCMVVDSAVTGNLAFQSIGLDSGSTSISPNSLLNLAARITFRLLDGDSGRIVGGMDSKLYSNATRDMSNAVLLLVDSLTNQENSNWPNATDFLQLVPLLSRAVASSSLGDDSDAEAPTRYERTTVLASTLSLLLLVVSREEPDLLIQYRDDLLLAGNALAKLSVFEVSSTSQDSTCIVSLVARSNLSTMVDTCSDGEESKGSSFVFQLMTTLVSKSFMGLVTSHDMNICSLLQSIAHQCYGAEVLINARVLAALETAAMTYAKQEADLTARLHKEGGGYHQVKIIAPDFLMGHLKLIDTIMASSTLPMQTLHLLPEQMMQILRHYKNTFQRLCCNFPYEGDILRAFLRCFVHATSTALPSDPSERYSHLQPSFHQAFQDLFSQEGFLENGVLIICKQLLEHPMPRWLLPPPPPSIKHDEKSTIDDSVVKVESDRLQSWWDVLEVLLASKGTESIYVFEPPIGSGDFGYWGNRNPAKWNENKFEYAIVAADVLSLCLSLLKKLDSCGSLGGMVLARGLHQLTLASQASMQKLTM